MIDAWGKIPEGILAGHTSSYGDFDECVQIEVTGLKYIGQVLSKSRQFDGLYCSAMIIDYNTAMSMTPVPVEAKLTSNNNTVQEAVSLEEFLVKKFVLYCQKVQLKFTTYYNYFALGHFTRFKTLISSITSSTWSMFSQLLYTT